MTITQTVEITEDRRLTIEVPLEIPEGKTDVVIQFPVQGKVQMETAEKPKMHIPKDSNGKFMLTKEILDEMERNSPITQRLSGILSCLGDVDLNEVRLKMLAKHL